MESDSREALGALVTAFEVHLEAVASRRAPEDATVDDAYDALAEAFERYEEALDDEYGEAVPMVVMDDGDDDSDSDDDDEDDDEVDVEAYDPAAEIDAHAEEDENELDDDIVEFDLKS